MGCRLRVVSDVSVNDVKEQLRIQFEASKKGDTADFYCYVDGAVWKLVEMAADDFHRLRLIPSAMWNNLSNQTREPIAVAESLKTGYLNEYEEATKKRVAEVSEHSEWLTQPIFVREMESGEWLVFDGCTRCVSRALSHLESGKTIEPMQAYFGIAPRTPSAFTINRKVTTQKSQSINRRRTVTNKKR
jgi:hypothetical protein